MRLIKSVVILAVLLWGTAGTVSLAGGLRMVQDAARPFFDNNDFARIAGELVSLYRQLRDLAFGGYDLSVPVITGDITGAALALLMVMAWWRARRLSKRSWTYSDACRRTYAELESALQKEWETADQGGWGSYALFCLAREGRMRARAEHAARALILSQSPVTRAGQRFAAVLKTIVFLLPTLTSRGQGSARAQFVSYAPRNLAWLLAFDLKLRKRPATNTAQILLWLDRRIDWLAGHLAALAVIAVLFGAVWGVDRIYEAAWR